MKATIEQHLCFVLCIKFLIHANLDFEKFIVPPSLFSVHWPQFLTRGYARAYHELLQGLRYANESLTHS